MRFHSNFFFFEYSLKYLTLWNGRQTFIFKFLEVKENQFFRHWTETEIKSEPEIFVWNWLFSVQFSIIHYTESLASKGGLTYLIVEIIQVEKKTSFEQFLSNNLRRFQKPFVSYQFDPIFQKLVG